MNQINFKANKSFFNCLYKQNTFKFTKNNKSNPFNMEERQVKFHEPKLIDLSQKPNFYKDDINFNVPNHDHLFQKVYTDPKKDFGLDLIPHSSKEELYEIMKNTLDKQNPKESPDWNKWNVILERLNKLLCSKQLTKNDIIDCLSLLNSFQPKLIEKNLPPEIIRKPITESQISEKHQDEIYNYMVSVDYFTRYLLHIKKYFTYTFSSLLFDEMKKKEKFTSQNEYKMDDVIGVYIVFFENIERKITDDIIHGRADYSFIDCVLFIQAFSRAKEGTNLFYEVMMRKISKNIVPFFKAIEEGRFDFYEGVEVIELIINHLPHDLYNPNDGKLALELHDLGKFTEEGITENIEIFYKEILLFIVKNISKFNENKFISYFQGVMRIKFNIDENILNVFLTEFNKRLEVKPSSDESRISFIFDFLQILAYFLKANEKILELVDLNYFMNIVNKNLVLKYKDSLSLNQISTLFWCAYNYKTFNNELVVELERRIESILDFYLNDPKEKIDTIGYESTERYYNLHNIERYDLEALQFFLNYIQYKGILISKISKSLKIIEKEDTHPLVRSKLF